MAGKITKVSPVGRLFRLAARQRGGFRTDQALQLGVTQHQLQHLVDKGLVRRRRRGLYEVVGAPADHHQAAMFAVLAAPEGAVASHETAAYLHGLCAVPSIVHVTVGRDQRLRMPKVVAHRSVVPPSHRAIVGGVPATSLSRTVVDLASATDLDTVADILDPLLVDERVRPDRLLRVIDEIVDAPGRHGTSLLRQALEVWTRPIEPGSVAEARLLRRLVERGFDGFVTQHEVSADGNTYFLDVAWPDRRRALEYSGAAFHGPRRWPRDERRAAALKGAGWTLREVDAVDLVPSKPHLWDWLQHHLRAAA